MTSSALLVLEDGSVFSGVAIGAHGHTVGEVVFNTSMTGYQEIVTDPSYSHQIVTLTYPHIGNTGTNEQDVESNRVHASGLIIRDLPLIASNFRNQLSLSEYLRANNLVGIAEIDTRKLTRILREKGALTGCIIVDDNLDIEGKMALAQNLIASFSGLKGMDLAQLVTTEKAYVWQEPSWTLADDGVLAGDKVNKTPELERKYKVVAYDYGVKANILRMLVDRGCEVTLVPAKTPAADVLAMSPDGVFLSNGPGDPEPCDYAITAIQQILSTQIPVFGICLGHQLLALANGAKTQKMKFGHHGANHPVQDIEKGTVMITSQNHGFAVDESSLPTNIRATHKSLFDGTLQGIHLVDKPAFSFQGHPEASPGPHDCAPLFDHFIALIEQYRHTNTL